MEKKGVSMVIMTLIPIFLALVIIGSVWIVVQNIISEDIEEISLEEFAVDLEIKKVEIQENDLIIAVSRKSGQGNLVGIKFIVNDDENNEVIEMETSMKELETNNFIFSGIWKYDLFPEGFK